MLNDIAEKLGVSKTTVSRAISGKGRLSENTRKRVLKYINEIGYVPNAAAYNLATTKTGNIAFAMPHSRDSAISSYFLECLFGVSQVAAEASYDVIVVRDEWEAISRIVNSRKADGVVISRNSIGDAALQKLAVSDIPIVLTGSANAEGIIQISYDARAAFRELTMRLMDMWPGKIGLIVAQKDSPANITRAEGYTDALTIKNQPLPHIAWDAVTESKVYQAFSDMYRNDVSNFVCGDDVVCMNLLNTVQKEKGCNEINIASFHNSHYLETFHPGIPVVSLDPIKLGDIACKMLLRNIEGKETPVTTLLDYSLRI
jgi:DNA-binding LacI/PurR family transcriptional regulator